MATGRTNASVLGGSITGQTTASAIYQNSITNKDPIYNEFGVVNTYSISLETSLSNATGMNIDTLKPSYSKNNQFFAVPRYASISLDIYEISGTTYTRLTDPAILRSSIAQTHFSPDGKFLAVSHPNTSPYITIYEISGTTFTALSDPAILPTNSITIRFSNDSRYLVTDLLYTSPILRIYEVSGNTFNYLATPFMNLNTSIQCFDTNFSKDNRFLAVSHERDTLRSSIGFSIFDMSTFTRLPDTNISSFTTVRSRTNDFSPDGKFLAVGHDTYPYIRIYEISGTTFTALSNPAILPTGQVYGVKFTKDSKTLICNMTASPYIYFYDISGTTFTKQTNPATLPTPTVAPYSAKLDTSFHFSKSYAGALFYDSPSLYIYEVSVAYNTSKAYNGLSNAWSDLKANQYGYATETGVSGDTKTVVITHDQEE